MNFYETIDNVFSQIFEKYGETSDFIEFKEKLLDSYINENKKKSGQIHSLIKPKLWKLDLDGNIILLDKNG